MSPPLSRSLAITLFVLVVAIWGANWIVTKTLVQTVPPVWTIAIRSSIATAVLFVLQVATRQFIIPKRGDIPVICTIGLLHMVIYSTLVAFGVQFVPAGRSIVLGYTTPLWVGPGAWLFLHEPISRSQIAGIALGIIGLLVMFNPVDFNWEDHNALLGNALILLAAVFWAANILYVRAHKWISTPFQLVFWQALLATTVLLVMAFSLEGIPHITWNPTVVWGFLYAGIISTAIAYWFMAVINRSLPALTTSLGILAAPVLGVAISVVALDEPLSNSLLGAMLMILCGIVIGIIPTKKPVALQAEEPLAATSDLAQAKI